MVVLVACGSAEEARRIARALVEGRLAACVNILAGLESVYRWKGAVEEAAEWLLIVKTVRGLFERLQAKVRALHSYELPEIVALPVETGLEEYLSWIAGSVEGGD
jgi:periplasmic divalent cation tolerance protein